MTVANTCRGRDFGKVKCMEPTRVGAVVIAVATRDVAAFLAERSEPPSPPAPAHVALLETVGALITNSGERASKSLPYCRSIRRSENGQRVTVSKTENLIPRHDEILSPVRLVRFGVEDKLGNSERAGSIRARFQLDHHDYKRMKGR